MFKFG